MVRAAAGLRARGGAQLKTRNSAMGLLRQAPWDVSRIGEAAKSRMDGWLHLDRGALESYHECHRRINRSTPTSSFILIDPQML